MKQSVGIPMGIDSALFLAKPFMRMSHIESNKSQNVFYSTIYEFLRIA